MTLTYDNVNEIQYFSALTLHKTYSETGIATAQLSFQTPAPFTAQRAAKVNIEGLLNTTDYFISSRSLSNGVWSVNCVDRNAFLDESIELSADEEKAETIDVQVFCEKIKEKIGYTAVNGIPAWLQVLPVAEVQDNTFSSVLNKIATAAYGVWCCRSGEVLEFVPYGYATQRVPVSQHTALDIAESPRITGILLEDAEGNVEKIGEGIHKYELIEIQSTLYSYNTGYAEDLQDRLLNGTNNFNTTVSKAALTCEKAILQDVPDTVSFYDFEGYEGVSYSANSVDISITPQGLFATLSNSADTDEIGTLGIVTRALQNSVNYGMQGKNAVLTRFQGLMYSEEAEPGV